MKLLSDEVSDEGDMGDEVEAAYEEFLQEQTQNNGSSSQSNGPYSNQMVASHHYYQQQYNNQQIAASSPYIYQVRNNAIEGV